MAAEPPQPPERFPWEPEQGGHAAAGRPRPRARGDRWWRVSGAAWHRLRSLPVWAQAVLWLLAWPVTTALYVASVRRLGRLAPPLTAFVLLCGGVLWWGEPFVAASHDDPQEIATVGADPSWDTAWARDQRSALPVAGQTSSPSLAEFNPSTVSVEITECVQTRSVSTVRERTVRQPRVSLRVTNSGPQRTIVLHAGVLLHAYDWNGGWKPTSQFSANLAHGETVEATLMPDYRHQASYTPDGLQACALMELEVLAARAWPEHPARRTFPLEHRVAAASEREFDPRHDLRRTDAR